MQWHWPNLNKWPLFGHSDSHLQGLVNVAPIWPVTTSVWTFTASVSNSAKVAKWMWPLWGSFEPNGQKGTKVLGIESRYPMPKTFQYGVTMAKNFFFAKIEIQDVCQSMQLTVIKCDPVTSFWTWSPILIRCCQCWPHLTSDFVHQFLLWLHLSTTQPYLQFFKRQEAIVVLFDTQWPKTEVSFWGLSSGVSVPKMKTLWSFWSNNGQT